MIQHKRVSCDLGPKPSSGNVIRTWAQGLSFDTDVSSEDAETVERGKTLLRQALKVTALCACLPSPIDFLNCLVRKCD